MSSSGCRLSKRWNCATSVRRLFILRPFIRYFTKNIPIFIKNTFNPSAPGTLISEDNSHAEGKAIKGISSINDTCFITLSGMGMVGVIGINSRIFNRLAKSGISVFLVSQASSENNTTFAVRNADAELAVKVLREEFRHDMAVGEISAIESEKDLATVAIVGENMKHTPGIAGKLFNVLGAQRYQRDSLCAGGF